MQKSSIIINTRNKIRFVISAVLMACISLNCGVSNVTDFQPEWVFLFGPGQETTTETPTETPSETPDDASDDIPTDTPDDTPDDTPVETPVENPAISNVIDGSVIESGVIVGTATGDVASVEVRLDGGPYQPAEGTKAWSFSLPTGSDIWLNGTAHTIEVRIKDSLGDYTSENTAISIRKGKNKDINGDGYVDLAVGGISVGSETEADSVYIYQSSAGSVSDSTIPNILVGVDTGNFGSALLLGDINVDGYADLVVSAPDTNSSTGSIYIYSGSVNGISSSTAFTTINGMETSSNFGSSLAMGDINADGYTDLVVSANSMGSYNGSVSIYQGSIDGINSTTAFVTFNGLEDNGYYGCSIALGDINDDGYDDLVVGAYGENSSAGRAYIYSGSSSGVSSTSVVTLNGEAKSDHYGYTLDLGDLNGDGYDELVVSAMNSNSDMGSAYIYSGNANGIDSSSEFVSLKGVTSNSDFGSVLTLGDINGDGYDDLVVGEQLYGFTPISNIYIYSGSIDGVSSSTSFLTINNDPELHSDGLSLAMADFNGDGYSDLVIGNYDSDGRGGEDIGTARIYNGGTDGLDSSTSFFVDGVIGLRFGIALGK